jgi:hypothetical protein
MSALASKNVSLPTSPDLIFLGIKEYAVRSPWSIDVPFATFAYSHELINGVSLAFCDWLLVVRLSDSEGVGW